VSEQDDVRPAQQFGPKTTKVTFEGDQEAVATEALAGRISGDIFGQNALVGRTLTRMRNEGHLVTMEFDHDLVISFDVAGQIKTGRVNQPRTAPSALTGSAIHDHFEALDPANEVDAEAEEIEES
jgi:hypothetical protein